ncbi:MAG: SagB/ThcOx family dehydrogenase [Desulfobacterales bacterium]|nr:SagB/ThcOx family dehydrogenase [Desulfobacteraceae bacterium]MBT4364544.1 SagB/ThcOx family dehydrogenase [Desulfobacteraceae bacterium]MBT7085944.1 SagB/ThcOx family dehydrogenase [Desulfobacterales bacterium]MBT7696910.1 SagB/ThcOx family dehydrogenase [Desulfobacterales bacterium]
MGINKSIDEYRFFLKDTIRKEIDFRKTDQSRGIKPPPMEKDFSDEPIIELTSPDQLKPIGEIPIIDAIRNRKSRRSFSDTPLSLEEISFLLWATQGVRDRSKQQYMFRTVPSAGARHALETYLYIRNVQNIPEGIYRYLPIEHQLIYLFSDEYLKEEISTGCFGQSFITGAAAVFIWTAIPYRMEWRYDLAAHKVIAIDTGHVAQNLYLACEAISAGTCAVAAYDQEKMDTILKVDGEDEFTIYLAPVGKKRNL